MKIVTMTLGMIQEQSYLIIDEATKQTFIVDPGDEANRILAYLEKEGLKLHKILLTHGHFDHIGAADALRVHTGAPIVCHTKGKMYLEDISYNLSAMGGEPFTLQADEYVEDGEHISLPGTSIDLEVIHIPGHTQDGVAFYEAGQGVVFVGDIIFSGSIGRTDFKGGNTVELLTGIQQKLFTLPDDVTIYPGHGPQTTVSHEKNTNAYFNMFD